MSSARAIDRSEIVAGVLIGGGGKRMGRPKHMLPHPSGVTFVEHVVEVASHVADEVVLLGVRSDVPPGLARCRRLADKVPGGGPAAGLCALLEHAGPERWGLLLACDLAQLDVRLLRRLVSADAGEADAVVFIEPASRRPHPCCALYRGSAAMAAEAALMHHGGRLRAVLDDLRVTWLEVDEQAAEGLMNVNTRADLAVLLSKAAGGVIERGGPDRSA